MIDELLSELGDDSEDLTDEEVARAIIVQSEDKLIAALPALRCEQCNEQLIDMRSAALRRRAPFLYGRMVFGCAVNHERRVVFRLDWLRGSS